MIRKFIKKFYKINNNKRTAMKAKEKKAAKKVPRVTKKNNKPMVVAEGERGFWVKDGPILRDLLELRDAILSMTEEQFSHHTGQGRNDFSVWVCEVLCDDECAKNLLKAKTQAEAAKAVEKAVRAYK
jgi:hypothetical protein